MKKSAACLILLLSFLIVISGCNSVHDSYYPREGDILFQSSPPGDLVRAIEGMTNSPYSHCGVLVRENGKWAVIEAIGPVTITPYESFIRRGRTGSVDIYRLDESHQENMPEFISALRLYLGRPYDFRFRMDDECLYCSELVYKAYRQAYGAELGKLAAFSEMPWQRYEKTIRKYEGGHVPLERKIISPCAISKASQLLPVATGVGPQAGIWKYYE